DARASSACANPCLPLRPLSARTDEREPGAGQDPQRARECGACGGTMSGIVGRAGGAERHRPDDAVPFLSTLSAEDRDALVGMTAPRRVSPGAALLHRGARDDSLLLASRLLELSE